MSWTEVPKLWATSKNKNTRLIVETKKMFRKPNCDKFENPRGPEAIECETVWFSERIFYEFASSFWFRTSAGVRRVVTRVGTASEPSSNTTSSAHEIVADSILLHRDGAAEAKCQGRNKVWQLIKNSLRFHVYTPRRAKFVRRSVVTCVFACAQ